MSQAASKFFVRVDNRLVHGQVLAAWIPHLRVDACERCKRYIVSVDARLEGHAVPVVDELAAIPLEISAVERGFTKVTPNLMGF